MNLKGRRVRVYRNLRNKCYSVKDMATGRVIAHVKEITLSDVTFPVSQAGRKKVLKDKQKNVHAFVQGIVDTKTIVYGNTRICYNPYKKGYFFYCSNGREIRSARAVLVDLNGVLAML